VAIIGKAPYKVPVLGTLRVNFIFRKVWFAWYVS
jgi:hypothetical protein